MALNRGFVLADSVVIRAWSLITGQEGGNPELESQQKHVP